MTTIYDIAKALGVAPSTVSKALNGGSGVSEKTRNKIIRYANKVRYIPNANASRLKTKRSYSIGIIYSENLNIGLEHHFFSSVIQAFKDYVETKGYEITFVIRNLGNTEMTFLEFCKHKQLDGVFIVVAEHSDKDLQELIDSDIPCVTTDLVEDNIFTVMTDNEYGAKRAVLEFFNNGHRQIAHITGSLNSYAGSERLVGYRKGMNEVGLEDSDDLIFVTEGFTFEDGYVAAGNVLAMDEIPTAVFAAGDDLAFGAIKRFHENGYRVPQDIAVIGFDDGPFAKYFDPPLSTLHQDRLAIGVGAAKYLIQQIEEGQDESSKMGELRIRPTFVKRESA
ncbi:LacI family DNA-binding transcriptional regulator [Candidatus Xianfuyuplasma coldseepsis]|uniref:LacI family transcriptional regulator n=1 Tax=Candidatus Xianfuyuplasma coldseepsis TaxID=2782163 RepID=A0A7L7KPS3_9MOLU|nr:LacI family DNA-binding transcriptional regulator [Xianfuyuplasma coldseepsis]QMS84439.1 LacI family transcriptional regulator [Xianfuyuplasma coldseepsis]